MVLTDWGPTYVFPIGEFLGRVKMSRRMRKRVRRANPHGKPEGMMPKGMSGRQIIHADWIPL